MKYEQCGVNSCQVHMMYLFQQSKDINTFSDWRNNTVYTNGRRLGGEVCRQLRLYGYLTAVPIIIHFSFIVSIFVLEKRAKERKHGCLEHVILIFEILLVLIQWYAPYIVVKYLLRYIFKHRDEAVLEAEKERFERDIGVLEPFAEAVLQVLFNILLYTWNN